MFGPGRNCFSLGLFSVAGLLTTTMVIPGRATDLSTSLGLLGVALVLLLVGTATAGIGWGLDWVWQRHVAQPIRDRRAERLAAEVIDGPGVGGPKFALYLRPFSSTGRAEVALYEDSGSSSIDSLVADRDLERHVALALWNSTPLVALGAPGEAIGAGRIRATEQNWRARIESLAERARVLLVLPSDHIGTRFEIDLILRRSWLHRTVFIMPGAGSEDWQRRWRQTQEVMAQRGLHLPAHCEEGLVFSMAPAGDGQAYMDYCVYLPQGFADGLFARPAQALAKAMRELETVRLAAWRPAQHAGFRVCPGCSMALLAQNVRCITCKGPLQALLLDDAARACEICRRQYREGFERCTAPCCDGRTVPIAPPRLGLLPPSRDVQGHSAAPSISLKGLAGMSTDEPTNGELREWLRNESKQ